jgi:hypothetical protein
MLLTKLKTSEGMLAVPCPYETEDDASSAEAADFRTDIEGALLDDGDLVATLEPAVAPPPRGGDKEDATEKAEASAVTTARTSRSRMTAARRRKPLDLDMIRRRIVVWNLETSIRMERGLQQGSCQENRRRNEETSLMCYGGSASKLLGTRRGS